MSYDKEQGKIDAAASCLPAVREGQALRPSVPTLPASVESVRERLLLMAGFDMEERARVIKRCINTQVDALEAVKDTVRDKFTGEEIDIPDWNARLRASEGLEVLLGVQGSRQANAAPSPGGVSLTIEIADFSRRAQVVDAEVIDAEKA